MDYGTALATWTPEQWQQYGSLGGTGDMLNAGTTTTNNPMAQYMNTPGLGGLTQGTWNNAGQAAGLAGTAYGIYDSLLGNKADLFKEQMGMLKDQRAQNKKMIADRETFKQNIGSGLANAFASNPAVI